MLGRRLRAIDAVATASRYSAAAVARRRVVAGAAVPLCLRAQPQRPLRFASTKADAAPPKQDAAAAAAVDPFSLITLTDNHLARPVTTPHTAALSHPTAPSGPVEFTPRVAATSPYSVSLVQGKTYTWCSCGHSRKQPWCDRHCFQIASPYLPVRFVANTNADKVLMCGCKHTRTAPFCSGEHVAMRATLWRTYATRTALIAAALLGCLTILGTVDGYLERTSPARTAAVVAAHHPAMATADSTATVAAAAAAATPTRR